MVTHTDSKYKDYEDLVYAFAILSKAYELIQDGIEQASNQANLYDIQRRIDVTDYEVILYFSFNFNLQIKLVTSSFCR
jgi:hypothetical protein